MSTFTQQGVIDTKADTGTDSQVTVSDLMTLYVLASKETEFGTIYGKVGYSRDNGSTWSTGPDTAQSEIAYGDDLYFGKEYFVAVGDDGALEISENGGAGWFKNTESSQDLNEKLCNVRETFEKYNLISGLHSYMSEKNIIYKNILPPLKLLSETDKKELFLNLNKLDFNTKNFKAA